MERLSFSVRNHEYQNKIISSYFVPLYYTFYAKTLLLHNDNTKYSSAFPPTPTATNCRYHNTTLIFREATTIHVESRRKIKTGSIDLSYRPSVTRRRGTESRHAGFAFSVHVSRIIGLDVGHGTAKCRSRPRYNGKKRFVSPFAKRGDRPTVENRVPFAFQSWTGGRLVVGQGRGVEEKDEAVCARSISIAFLRVPFCEIGVWTYRFRGTWSLPRLERKIPLLIIFMACFYGIKRSFIFERDLEVRGVFWSIRMKVFVFIGFTLSLFELKDVCLFDKIFLSIFLYFCIT